MAKKKSATTTTPPTEPTPQPNANGGGEGDPKWQRMQQPQTPEPPEGDPGEGEPGNEGEPQQATAPEPGGEGDPQQPEPGGDDRTFSQAEVDQLIADRLKRERKKYADYNDLKTKAKKFDEAEREKLDEVERLKLEKQEAEDRAAQAEQAAQQQQISNAVLAGLTEFKTDKNLGFRQDAIRAALRLVDLSEIEVDGNEVTGVEEAVKALAQDHPFLLQQSKATTPTSPTNPARTEPQGTTDEERRLRYFGGGGSSFFNKRQEGVVYPEE